MTEQPEVRSGGVMGGRALDLMDLFEVTVELAFGDLVRADKAVAVELWCALANVSWHHESAPGGLLHSFRGAGDLVAALRGDGDYMDWYCSGRDGVVTSRIADGLFGWTPEVQGSRRSTGQLHGEPMARTPTTTTRPQPPRSL